MLSTKKIVSATAMVAFFSLAGICPAQTKTHEWLTWGGDTARSGWNRTETGITAKNVGTLEVRWKAQLEKTVPIEVESGAATLTAPLVVEGVKTAKGVKTLVFTLSWANTLSAIDADTGAIVWQRAFTNKVAPLSPASWVCTNTTTATPVIDKAGNIIYMISADGVLHGVALTDGEDKFPPTDFTPPYSRNWSLNLVDGVLYTTVGRGCGGSRTNVVSSAMVAMDLKDPGHPIAKFPTSPGRPAGAWSRGGMVSAYNSFFVQTADGDLEPAAHKWGNTLLRLAPKTLELQDYFVPPNFDELNTKDLDFGSGGPVTFTFEGRDFVATGGKDGTIYLLDAKSLGGADHRTPLYSLKIGNDEGMYASYGFWGAMATMADSKGGRWLYVPIWGPPSKEAPFKMSNGDAADGSIMALKVVMENGKPVLAPMWTSRNMSKPEPPLVVNGMVFAVSSGENTIQRHTDPRYLSMYHKAGEPPLTTQGVMTPEQRGMFTTHATLYAFDAETGKELFSSKDSIDDWSHYSSVTAGNGLLFVTTRKTNLYAFGRKK